jgi:hypothetical protein
MHKKHNLTLKARELKLGDVVKLSENAWSTATVTQIKDGLISLHRPYTHTSDIEYSGGLIAYTGLETFCISQDSDTEYFVYHHDKPIQ